MRVTEKKMTDDPIVIRILNEIKLQGKTEREVEEWIGLGTGAFTRWKYSESKTYMRYMVKIADYLNVTTEYLLGNADGEVKEDTMSSEELRLVRMYRKMDSGKRNCLLKTAEYFLAGNERT